MLNASLSDRLHPYHLRLDASLNSARRCPTRSWSHWLHGFLSGSGSLAGRRSYAFPDRGHTYPDEWRATRNHLANTSVSVLSGTVSPAAKCTFLFGSSYTSSHVCGVSNCGRTVDTVFDSVENTDKSSASHHCKLKTNDQIDARLALAKL